MEEVEGDTVTAPPVQQDDPKLRLQYYRETGQVEEAKLYEQYLRETGQGGAQKPAVPSVRPDATSALPRNRENASGDLEVLGRGVAANVLNAAQGVPGMKAFEAAAGSLGSKFTDRPMSYRESHDVLTAETEKIPAPLRIAERIAGAGPLTALLPTKAAKTVWEAIKSGTKAGAGLGAADAALDANPNATLGDRAKGAVVRGGEGAAIGGTLGAGLKASEVVPGFIRNWLRIKNAGPLDEQAVALDKEIADATKANYGKAADEGAAAGGTSPALKDALEHPLVKPYADIVRESHAGKTASDAVVAQKAYKLISRQRGGYKRQMAEKYDAKVDMQAEDLKEAAGILKAATAAPGTKTTITPAPETAQSPAPDVRTALREHQARPGIAAARKEGTVEQQKAREALERHASEEVASPPLRGAPTERVTEEATPGAMPSFPHAVSEKARMEGERAAHDNAADATRRIMRGTSIPADKGKLLTKSGAAFGEDIKKMSPGEVQQAIRAVLSRAKEEAAWKPRRSISETVMHLGEPAKRANRIAPFLKQLDEKAGAPSSVPPELSKLLMEYLARLNAPVANP